MSELPFPPESVLAASPEQADELLTQLERTVPLYPPFLSIPAGAAREAVVFGDTHGDWRSSVATAELFDGPGSSRRLIGLGDYVDRAPDDSGEGSVANAFYLLSLAAKYPDRVILLQGNHETTRRVPASPHHLPEEVDELWGPESERYDRLMGLLERGPIAAATPSGVYFAHAGFPRHLLEPWPSTFAKLDLEGLCEVVWAECDAARSRRGAAPPWSGADLDRFLDASGLSIMLRGHDPDLTGRPLYAGRCLTLQTTRIYERFGGVIVAVVPLEGSLRSVAQLTIRHLPTEGRSYPPP